MEGHAKSRLVTVELSAQDYLTASAAHQGNEWISCTGELARHKGSFQLRNPRGFEVVELDDDDDDNDGRVAVGPGLAVGACWLRRKLSCAASATISASGSPNPNPSRRVGPFAATASAAGVPRRGSARRDSGVARIFRGQNCHDQRELGARGLQ